MTALPGLDRAGDEPVQRIGGAVGQHSRRLWGPLRGQATSGFRPTLSLPAAHLWCPVQSDSRTAVTAAGVADARAITSDAVTDAAADDLGGWNVTAAAAEVPPGPPFT